MRWVDADAHNPLRALWVWLRERLGAPRPAAVCATCRHSLLTTFTPWLRLSGQDHLVRYLGCVAYAYPVGRDPVTGREGPYLEVDRNGIGRYSMLSSYPSCEDMNPDGRCPRWEAKR